MSQVASAVFEGHYLCALPRPDRLYRQLWRRLRRPSLDTALVRDVLDEYGLTLLRMDAGPADPGRRASAVIETSAGKKLFKGYGQDADLAAVVHEHSILAYLGEVGFPAPRLTRTPGGETFVSRDGEVFALSGYLEGYLQYHNLVFVPPRTREFVVAAGRALGLLHWSLKDFVPAGRNVNGFRSRAEGRWRDREWSAEQMLWFERVMAEGGGSEGRAAGPDLVGRARPIAETFHQLDESLEAAAPPRLVIHGDYGPYNLLFRPGMPVVVIDFELAHLDWRLTDLAWALGHFAMSRTGADFRKMSLFLGAYAAAFPLERGELELLPSVWQHLTLRQLINCCHRYCVYRDANWLAKARQKLNLVDWLRASQSLLRDVCRTSS